jgi:HSP20 family protein
MTTLEKSRNPSFADLFWSTWPFSTVALELPVADDMLVRVEEFVEGDTVVVRAELPGIDPDKDVEVSVADGLLMITAERREERDEGTEGKPGYRSEFRYGSLRRVLRMPAGAREEDVTATYADGILEIRMPTAAVPATPNRISVTRT